MQQSFDFITKKIQDLKKEINKTASISGLLVFFSCSFLIFSSFGLLESIFYLPKLTRNLILTAVIFTLIFVFWRFFLVSFLKLFGLFNPQTEETIAKFIGKKHTEIADKLLNSLQLYHEAKQNQNFEGKIFVELALEKSAKSLENINLLADVDKKPVKINSKFLGISVLVALMPVLIFGTSYFTSFERIFSPTKEFAPPAEFSLEVFPKNTKILKGDSLQVFAKGKGDLPKKINLFLKEDGFQEVRTVSLDSSSSYKITLEGIRKEFIYHFEGEKENKFGKLSFVKTPLYKVEVGERPYVKSFTVKIIPPGYSKTPAINLPPNTGEITALKGSKVEIDLSSNNFISKATIKFSKNKPLEMKILDNFASVDFFVLEDETYSFELTDTEKINSIDAISYKILALQDEFPVIKMVYPTEDKTLDESLEMPLAVEIMDDYGFSKLVLNYTLANKKNDEENLKFLTQKIEINPNITTFGQVQHLWKMLDLKMQPEDEVVFFLEIYDNDTISGPKKTQTEKLRLRYPSIEEIFSSFEEEQKEVTESLEEMLEKSKEAEKFLEKTAREFKKDQNLDWQEKKKLEETLRNQQEMNEKMDDLKEQMKEMVEELEKNNLISEEILKKYQELQEVLKEIATPEMKKAMEELQKALEQADQKQIEKAMQNFEISQKEYLENLERSLELFKNIQLEQKMDELVKRTEELAQKQNELNEQTAKSDSTSKQAGEELAKQQEELKKEEKSAEELAKEVEKLMEETKNQKPQDFQQVLNEMSEQNLQQQMQNVSQELKQGEQSSAKQKQQKIGEQLQKMAQQMQNAQKQMQQQQLEQMLGEMGNLLGKMLEVSKEQENLKNESLELTSRSPRIEQAAENQSNLLENNKQIAKQVSDLSKKSFHVSPSLLAAVGQGTKEMEQAVSSLADNNGQQASKSQQKATQAMNQAILQMNQAMQSMQQSGSASGLQQYMDALKKMAGQQQGLNEQTSQGMNGQMPGMLPGQKPGGNQPGGQGNGGMPSPLGMGNLAAQQKALQEALQSLKEKMGRDGVKGLGDLGEIGKEMGEVAKELQDKNVSQKTVQKQQRIFSRLLDAQRSINKEKISKKRESRTAEIFMKKDVGNLPENLGQKQNILRQDLLKALEEGYNKNYQELIKSYFDALQSAEKKQN